MFRRARHRTSPPANYISEEEVLAAEAADPDLEDALADAEHRLRLIRELVALRRNAKISQAEVARRMGTTQSAVSALEGGEHDPYLSTLQRYARAVRARVDVHVSVASWSVPVRAYRVQPRRARRESRQLVEELVDAWSPSASTTRFHRSEVELCK
ncbi:helix-turn-helix domain-containing protein [Micromonospora viridifaciens]|uniref:helix-turn-helix domain-containing protein n=1 Tax=Micromonospora viridifaciens TaxID=1881 RepID=UPI000B5ADDAC